ncbi:MAG: hypothetical protein QXG35_09770 [Nitrososphaerota archaeon]
MSVRQRAAEYVMQVLGEAGRVNVLKLVSALQSEFGLRRETAVEILKGLERAGKVKVQGNDMILASPPIAPGELDDDGREKFLLNYLTSIEMRGRAAEAMAQQEEAAAARYIVFWDVDMDKATASEIVRRYRMLSRILKKALEEGKTWERANQSVIITEDRQLALQIAAAFEDIGSARVYRILPA